MTFPDIRTLPFSASLTQANEIDWSWFVRVDIPAPVGTVRWTNRGVSVTQNMDGTSQLWTSADVIAEPISQSLSDPLQVSSVSFANIDYTWSEWAKSPGLRSAAVYVYRGWFNADGSFAGSFAPFVGRIGRQEHQQRSSFELRPLKDVSDGDRPSQSLVQIDPLFVQLMPDTTQDIATGPGTVITIQSHR